MTPCSSAGAWQYSTYCARFWILQEKSVAKGGLLFAAAPWAAATSTATAISEDRSKGSGANREILRDMDRLRLAHPPCDPSILRSVLESFLRGVNLQNRRGQRWRGAIRAVKVKLLVQIKHIDRAL